MCLTSRFFASLQLLIFLTLIINASACQPPMPMYHSAATFGTPQFESSVPLTSPEFSNSVDNSASLLQSQLKQELLQNQVQVNPSTETIENLRPVHDSSVESTEIATERPSFVIESSSSNGNEDPLSRPVNPFVPLEAKSPEKSAQECRQTNIEKAMDIVDCVAAQTFTEDGSIARYGGSDCDFSSNTLCRFYTASDETLRFRRGKFAHHSIQNRSSQFGRFDESFAVITRRPLGSIPDGDFILISEPFGNTPDAAAVLQSDIRCQVGNGDLSFDYWSTVNDVTLKVCTRVGQDRRCTSDIEYTPDSTRVSIQIVHPESENFVVEIIVTNFQRPGVFILDTLEARPSHNENARAFAQPTFDLDRPLLSIGESLKQIDSDVKLQNGLPSPIMSSVNDQSSQPTFQTPCDALDCNFNNGLCGYSQPELKPDVIHRKWQTANTIIGDLQVPKTQNGKITREGFAFVGLDDRLDKSRGRTVYVLKSPDIELTEDSTLEFDIFRRSNAISLQVCLDTPDNCPYEAPPLKNEKTWKVGEAVYLPKETKNIIFVATQWKRFKWLAIDNIRLTSSSCPLPATAQSNIL
ncbi:hypothetical protein M3Y95_00253200 [Aphelenchoides besseyi]|nr:hypothetical protein M3Y95_00253200 [Aphelenchoides besseyi]